MNEACMINSCNSVERSAMTHDSQCEFDILDLWEMQLVKYCN